MAEAASSFFNLSCDSYKQLVFSGFSRLQEQQEFVDLTLAADGHIVKVHKNVMALASPYIKELLKSTSSDNPVIFLNHVNHKVLNYLLEYIYQGEVNIPQDSIESFLQLSQSLHINGMGKPNISKTPPRPEHTNQSVTSGKLKQQILTNQNLTSGKLKSQISTNQNLTSGKMRSQNMLTCGKLKSQISTNQNLTSGKMRSQMLTSGKLKSQLLRNQNLSGGKLKSQISTNQNLTSGKMRSQMLTSGKLKSQLLGNQNLSGGKLKDQIFIPTCPPSTSQVNNISTTELAGHITINNDLNFDVQHFGNVQITNVQGSLDSNDVQIDTSADAIQAMPVIETFDDRIEIPVNMETDILSQAVQTNVTNQGEKSQFPIIEISTDFNEDAEQAGVMDLSLPINLDKEAREALKIITQYSITERGSMQIIFGRFLYCCHHSSSGGRKHRWRCIDYRRKRCKAYIDSTDDRITARKGVHTHPFHDDKIYMKHKKGKIYTSFGQAKDACLPPETKYSGISIEDLED